MKPRETWWPGAGTGVELQREREKRFLDDALTMAEKSRRKRRNGAKVTRSSTHMWGTNCSYARSFGTDVREKFKDQFKAGFSGNMKRMWRLPGSKEAALC